VTNAQPVSYTRAEMRALKTPVVLAAAALAISGCGGSHKKLAHGKIGGGADRSAFLHRALRLARASNSELSIFPASYSRRNCSIPRTVGGIHKPLRPLSGTCRTRFESSIDARPPRTLVIFTERWKWPPCRLQDDCVAAHLRRHTWLVTVQRAPARVLATHETGAPAPQAPKP
jgi:hypothetical protein